MSLAAPNLNDILLRVYDELGELQYGLATGGSATTLVDSGLGGADNDWNQGTVFVVEADAAAPEGEYAEVTAYTSSSGTLTFSSSGINGISSAPAADDEYALAPSKYPLDRMRGTVNRALVRLRDIPNLDQTLTTATNQKEYTIPAAARVGLRRVYLSQVSTANDEGWREMTVWRAELDALIFRQQPETGKTIKLVYMGPHTRLAANSDTLSPYVHINRIVAETVYLALRQNVRRSEGDDRFMIQSLNDSAQELESARRTYPIWDPGKPFKPILSGHKNRGLRRRAAYGPWITK